MQYYEELIRFWESNLLECPIKKHTGMDCLGCGMQRSFVYLLKGDLYQSILIYPALIPMLTMFVVLIAYLKYRFARGPQILLRLFILSSALAVGNFLFKLLWSS